MSLFKKMFAKRPKDERVEAEINKIYKIGFHVMSAVIVFDLYLQFADPNVPARPVEFWGFLLAQIVCIILMCRKGVTEDTSPADAETFRPGHQALVAFGASAAFGVLLAVLMYFRNSYLTDMPMQGRLLVVAITGLSVFLLAGSAIFGLQYAVFRIAKRRREAIAQALEDE